MALEPREAEIRGWVEQGRSDARIGEKLGTSAASIQSFRFHNSIPWRPALGEDELARVRTWSKRAKATPGSARGSGRPRRTRLTKEARLLEATRTASPPTRGGQPNPSTRQHRCESNWRATK